MKTKFTIFCFAFTVCANIHTVNAQVNVQDSLALVDLYNNTNGPNWTNNNNWLTVASVRNWTGVSVSSDNRVVYLFLEQNNLTGTIPSQLENLTQLIYLRLGNN